ncbi:MAG: AMP nucleosidase [Delftia tsuruhatensis]|nr:MAG: AMP nucleosidase [Delftia tsuruhatensis]
MVSLHNPSQASRAAATLHTDPQRALEHVQQIYREQIEHLRTNMQRFVSGETPAAPVHAYYPFVRMHTATVSRADTQLAYGFVEGPGTHEATLTRPDLFSRYYAEQFRLLIKSHGVPLEVGLSDKPIPSTSRLPRTTTSKARCRASAGS